MFWSTFQTHVLLQGYKSEAEAEVADAGLSKKVQTSEDEVQEGLEGQSGPLHRAQIQPLFQGLLDKRLTSETQEL